MKFMLSMIPEGYHQAEPGTRLDPERVDAMLQFCRALQDAGVLVSADGLHPPSEGARITFSTGRAVVTEGCWLDSVETLGGFWIIDVPSKADAIAWAKLCPLTEAETIEVRRLQEGSDFPVRGLHLDATFRPASP